jgi:hypothetical protein
VEGREKVGSVLDGGKPDVDPAQLGVTPVQPDVTAADNQEHTEPIAIPAERDRPRGKKRRGLGFTFFQLLKRLWIPVVILAVIAAGGFTVSRLHSIFGNEKHISYGDTQKDETKPFNPKYLTYEIWGPPGSTAQISFFDDQGNPKNLKGVSLPWSLQFPISTTASVGSIAAQGDGDTIGCRITVDGKVKSEKVVNQVSAFTSCLLKAA